MSNLTNKRRHFRIQYQGITQSPRLVTQGTQFRVQDLSESGICFLNHYRTLTVGTVISGTVEFPDRETVLIKGRIVRNQSGETALELAQPLPLPKIIAEQRRMIAKHN